MTSSNKRSCALEGVSRAWARPGRCTSTLRSVPTSESTWNDGACSSSTASRTPGTRSSISRNPLMTMSFLAVLHDRAAGAHLRPGLAVEQVVDLIEASDDPPAAGALDEAADRLDLRSHGSGGELAVAQPGRRRAGDRSLRRGAVAVVDGVDVGGQHERVDTQVEGQQCRREVLVDDGLHASEAAVRVLRDGHAAASCADHEKPRLDAALDRGELPDPQRLGRRPDSPPPAAGALDRPGDPSALGLGVDGSDELRRDAERGVVLVDDDARQYRN